MQMNLQKDSDFKIFTNLSSEKVYKIYQKQIDKKIT